MMTRSERRMAARLDRGITRMPRCDWWLVSVSLLLLLSGLVLVASASVTMADRIYSNPLHFFWRQTIAALIGCSCAWVILKIPLAAWEKASVALLALGFFLLVLVLIPGIGKEVNGSMRWISLGPATLQSSEPAKLCLIVYLAGYLVRHGETLKSSFAGFMRPISVVTLIVGLLMLEPDFGTAVVMFSTALAMLFVGGVPFGRFLVWVGAAVAALTSLVVLSPYRMQRLTSFADPWQDPFNSGFQLTQALIAVGRGDWLGVGLGASVQKLFYLPEAHTDFLFAVASEELGLIGSVTIILAFLFIVWRAFVIARVAHFANKAFAAYLAYGIGTLLGIQAFVNIGVNMGVLPTKGLTLPLMSYGSNSVIVTCMLIGILLRIEIENHFIRFRAIPEAASSYAA